jgi:hypothetical protein
MPRTIRLIPSLLLVVWRSGEEQKDQGTFFKFEICRRDPLLPTYSVISDPEASQSVLAIERQ